MSASSTPLSNPYQHVCQTMEGRHTDPDSCRACDWQEGYVAAVKNHDASGCPQVFVKDADWDGEDLTSA